MIHMHTSITIDTIAIRIDLILKRYGNVGERDGWNVERRKDGPDFEPRDTVCIPEIAQAPFQKL